MKIVQTKIGDAEYNLLKKKTIEKGSTIQDLLRDAIKQYIVQEVVNPNDPLFSEPVAETGAKDGSIRHNKYLYGGQK